jgi:hypothetical protein
MPGLQVNVVGNNLLLKKQHFYHFLRSLTMNDRFTGRKEELAELSTIKKLKKSNLVVISGRRRV